MFHDSWRGADSPPNPDQDEVEVTRHPAEVASGMAPDMGPSRQSDQCAQEENGNRRPREESGMSRESGEIERQRTVNCIGRPRS